MVTRNSKLTLARRKVADVQSVAYSRGRVYVLRAAGTGSCMWCDQYTASTFDVIKSPLIELSTSRYYHDTNHKQMLVFGEKIYFLDLKNNSVYVYSTDGSLLYRNSFNDAYRIYACLDGSIVATNGSSRITKYCLNTSGGRASVVWEYNGPANSVAVDSTGYIYTHHTKRTYRRGGTDTASTIYLISPDGELEHYPSDCFSG